MADFPLTAAEYAAKIEAQAVYFTACRREAGAIRRQEFPTKAEAIASATGDGRTMIYAVTADGRDAHICNA